MDSFSVSHDPIFTMPGLFSAHASLRSFRRRAEFSSHSPQLGPTAGGVWFLSPPLSTHPLPSSNDQLYQLSGLPWSYPKWPLLPTQPLLSSPSSHSSRLSFMSCWPPYSRTLSASQSARQPPPARRFQASASFDSPTPTLFIVKLRWVTQIRLELA